MSVEQVAMAMWWVDWLRSECNANRTDIKLAWTHTNANSKALYRQLALKFLRFLGEIK